MTFRRKECDFTNDRILGKSFLILRCGRLINRLMWVPPIYLQPCFDSDNENRLRGKWGCRSGSCRHGMELSIKFKLVCLHETNGNSAIIDRLCELWHLCVTTQSGQATSAGRTAGCILYVEDVLATAVATEYISRGGGRL